MIDLHAVCGDAKTDVDFDVLHQAMADQSVTVEEGDMVCLHTGFARKVLEMNREPDAHTLHNVCAALEGRDPKTPGMDPR